MKSDTTPETRGAIARNRDRKTKRGLHPDAASLAKLWYDVLDRLAGDAKAIAKDYETYLETERKSGHVGGSRLALRIQYKDHRLICSWHKIKLYMGRNAKEKSHVARYIKRAVPRRKAHELAQPWAREKVLRTEAVLAGVRKQFRCVHNILRSLKTYSDMRYRRDNIKNRPAVQ